MKTLIVYATRYGTTEACARLLEEKLDGAAELLRIPTRARRDFGGVDVVLVGGSIYGGTIQTQVGDFLEEHRPAIETRPLGLFLCGLLRGEQAQAQLVSAFPEWAFAHAFSRRALGGRVDLARLSLVDRILVRGLSPIGRELGSETVLDRIAYDQVDLLAADVNALPR